ncbi:oligopeptide/dipeptide ABC transporter ATP-binding protein [Arthrobacter sp. LAPM80]|uniref:oligopeptide/dipeptide ABC transporter ATP-binding protein n=1 Tax=Arthrobacter sp. LAPM80 TaxID=3141788 RepID=UPI00398A6358
MIVFTLLLTVIVAVPVGIYQAVRRNKPFDYIATALSFIFDAAPYLGKMVKVGPAAEVYAHPQHPYTRGLIDTVPIPDSVAERAKAKLGVAGELPSAMNPPSGYSFHA